MNNEMTTEYMSTEEIIDILKGIVFNGFDRTTPKERQALHLAIKALEERPQGKWVFDSEFTEFGNPYGTYRCSICGCHSSNTYSFCKDCGADMRGGVK